MTCHKLSKCGFFLYDNDLCLFCQHNDINEIQKHLNDDFCNICDWFVDNRLSIHFGEDKKNQYFLLLNLRGKIYKNLT